MASKLVQLFASSNPEVYASAFKAAVEQIEKALGGPGKLEETLRANAQETLDLADLVHAAVEEEEEEEKEEEKKEEEKKEPPKG